MAGPVRPTRSAPVGVANLELIDRLDLVTNAGETGLYFRTELAKRWQITRMSATCGDGLLAAVESVADKAYCVFFDSAKKIGPRIAAALAERGVIGGEMPRGDILGFAPPLCLTKEEADIVVEKTTDVVKTVFPIGEGLR